MCVSVCVCVVCVLCVWIHILRVTSSCIKLYHDGIKLYQVVSAPSFLVLEGALKLRTKKGTIPLNKRLSAGNLLVQRTYHRVKGSGRVVWEFKG